MLVSVVWNISAGTLNPAGADYPAGFARQAIGTGGFKVPALMFQTTDTNNVTKNLFGLMNAHDGTCT